MSPGDARGRGALLCERLAADVSSLVDVAALSAWPGTWRIVDPASASFVLALVTWEASPSERLRLRVRVAYDNVTAAWRCAAAEHAAQGREAGRKGAP